MNSRVGSVFGQRPSCICSLDIHAETHFWPTAFGCMAITMRFSNSRGDCGRHGIIVSFSLMSETWHELYLDFAGLSAFLCLLVLASALQRGPQLDRIQFWVQKG